MNFSKEKKLAEVHLWRTWVIWSAILDEEVPYILQKYFCCRIRPADSAKYIRHTCRGERGNFGEKTITILFSSVRERGILDKVIGYFAICHWFYQDSAVEMEKGITLKYLEDDDEKMLPESMACFSILHLPTVHSIQISSNKYFNQALEFEASSFSARY